MKTKRIAIKPESSLEAILSLAPTVLELKVKHAGAEIGLIAEECFREASFLIPGIDFLVSELPNQNDFEIYDFSNFSGESWGLESLEWKAYLQGCSTISPTNPYHQIDLFRKAAQLENVEGCFELLSAKVEPEDLPGTLFSGDSLRIALCASSLSIDQLQAVLRGLANLSFPISIHLTGTISEKRKSSILLSAWGEQLNIVDLCGRQSFAQLGATLSHCDIVFTAPGSQAILSSGYGTFTVCIDEKRNPLHYPYGHGHLILQHTNSSEFFSSLSGISAEIIQFAVSGNNGNIPSLEQWQSFADDRVDNYLSKLRLFVTQRIETVLADGGSFTELYLRPLLYMGAEAGDAWQSFYRLLWGHSLSGLSITSHELQVLHDDTLQSICSDLKGLEQMYEVANFGRIYSTYIRDSLCKGDTKKAQHESKRLQEVEELLYSLGKSHSALAPICAFHEKRQQLIPLLEPLELAEQMTQQFSQVQERVLVLLDLTRSLFHTIWQSESGLSEEGRSDG